jgi:fructoselysine-6-P-deglycase FrlB-like protein
VIDDESVVWIFGTAPSGLLDELSGLGAVVVHGDLDPLAQLVLAQRLAVEVAERRGLDPASPRNLTRSIVLQG